MGAMDYKVLASVGFSITDMDTAMSVSPSEGPA